MNVEGTNTCRKCGHETVWPHRPKCEDDGCPGSGKPKAQGRSLEDLLRMTVPVPADCVAPEGSPMSPGFRVSVQKMSDDGVHFIIHADGHDSDTLDFVAKGNDLKQI